MTTTKKRGPSTRELLKLVATGAKLQPVFGAPMGDRVMRHEPRTKFDPQPWTDGLYRWHAWELMVSDS